MSPYLIDFYAGYIIRNTELNELQAAIKIARRNVNNLIYADYTILMAESEEKSKSILMRVKESEKASLRLSIPKAKIMASEFPSLHGK